MSDLYQQPDPIGAAPPAPRHRPPLQAEPQDGRPSVIQFLAPLKDTMASWHRRPHTSGDRVIIRFNNNYGVIISEYRLLAGTYEVAPLRFHGPQADDYEFYFRSHVPDLTWCSDHVEMVQVCEQIARLLPPVMA
jgi:hypothetical protein